MSLLAGDDDLERIRGQFDEVLSRREFDYGPSLLDRFIGWLGRVIERILELLHVPGTGAGGEGGRVGSYVVAAVLIIAVSVVVVLLIRRIRRTARRGERREDPSSVTLRVRDGGPGGGWMDDYLRGSSVGDRRRRILDAYRRLIGSLEGQGLLDPVAGDSPRELSDGLRSSSSPMSTEMMAEATDIFERPWYGGDDGAEDDAERLDVIASSILTERRSTDGGA